MSEDDDWFERALREDDEESESPEDKSIDSGATQVEQGDDGTDGPDDTPDADDGLDAHDVPDAHDAATDDAFEEDAGFGDDFDAEDAGLEDGLDADETGLGDGFGGDDGGFGDDDEDTPSADDAPSGGFADAEPYDGGDDDDGGLFDQDFASAFENAPGGDGGAGPASGSEASQTSDADGGGAFGSGGAFGGGGFDADADEGFGGGFGGGEPFENDDFDDEEFESAIPRIDVGIEGLDSMIQGGVPERSLITTIGSAGTGKTTFGLQFLHEALVQGENAVFITLEESHDRIVNTATEKGWDFGEYEEEGRLAVIDLDPIEMANSLTSIRNDLPRLVEQFGASRLVLDSVSLLEMMYDEQSTRRNEVYDFTKSLKEAGVTTMLTSEASEGNPYASRHGIIEYLVDAVFVLRYIRSTDDFRETRLAVEIQKIRDANHSREIKPYSITNEGISVYRQANIF